MAVYSIDMKYKGPLSTVNGKILLRIAVVARDTLQHRRLVFLVVKIDSLITVQMTEVVFLTMIL